MSITDELRSWVAGAKPAVINGCEISVGPLTSGCRGALVAIADRIDAEHQKALDEWKAKHGQMWLKGYAECHAELLEGNETIASDLESCGWIRLPKDADGEYINIHDCVEVDDGKRVRVDAIAPNAVYWWEGDGCHWCQSFMVSHYHAPTVEDVLREFAHVGIHIAAKHGLEAGEIDLYADEEAIAEYAAKLQLKEDE